MKGLSRVLLVGGMMLSGMMVSKTSIAASSSNGLSLADMISQLPTKTLGSVCGSGQESSVTGDLCSAQVDALRDQVLKQNPGLNVENMNKQAQTVFENTLQPLISALSSGNQ